MSRQMILKGFPFLVLKSSSSMCCRRLLVNRDSFCSEKVFMSICIPRIIQTRLRYTKTVERNRQAFVILLSLSLFLHSTLEKEKGIFNAFLLSRREFRNTWSQSQSQSPVDDILCKESRHDAAFLAKIRILILLPSPKRGGTMSRCIPRARDTLNLFENS